MARVRKVAITVQGRQGALGRAQQIYGQGKEGSYQSVREHWGELNKFMARVRKVVITVQGRQGAPGASSTSSWPG
jgi:hypothetical protein